MHKESKIAKEAALRTLPLSFIAHSRGRRVREARAELRNESSVHRVTPTPSNWHPPTSGQYYLESLKEELCDLPIALLGIHPAERIGQESRAVRIRMVTA